MRVLLPLLLIVVLSGCGSPDPVAEPVAEKKSEPQPVAPKTEAQPAAAQPEQPKNNPAPDAAGPQQAPANPPANPQLAQPPVAEKPQQPVTPNRAPGKVPLLVSVRTKAGKKHVGELIERTDAGLVVYDIVLRDTVSITKDQVQAFVEGIDERTASSHVPFATYAAWKLTKLLRIGTVQGRIALASDKGIFINLGSAHGLLAGQSVTLLGKAEEITDPESGEQLAVYRAPVATLKILTVVNERLSKLSITASDKPVKIERGMTVACERGATTIVVIPPQWKSEDPNLKTGDEALYLTEHLLTELVRYRLPVISRDQSDRIRDELANKTGQPNETVSPISIARELRAGVVLTGELLARGQTGNVVLHATDVQTSRYIGILSGRIRRDNVRRESNKAKKAAADIKRKIDSLPPLAVEMLRRKTIATKLIEGGALVVLQLPNGTKIAYRDKILPDQSVGFPRVFVFDIVTFTDGNAHLSSWLSGLRIHHVAFHLSDSSPDYFRVLNRGVSVWGALILRAPVEANHIRLWQPELFTLELGPECLLSGEWCTSQYVPRLFMLRPGGGIATHQLPATTAHLPCKGLYLSLPKLQKGWSSYIRPWIYDVGCPQDFQPTDENLEKYSSALVELRNTVYFANTMKVLRLKRYVGPKDKVFDEALVESILLSPKYTPTRLKILMLYERDLGPEILRRLRLRYPKVEILQ